MRPLLVAALLVLAACPGARTKTPAPLTPKQIVERSKPAIVRVEVDDDRVGTGFILDASGVVVTNLHVVVGSEDVKVRTLDGSVLTVTRILGLDPEHDLALLDVEPSQPLPTLRLGDSDQVAAGDPVLAIGNPLGVLDYTVSDGLISSVRQLAPGVTLLQISAPISQGSSGGPLFNPQGEVIGVATAIFNEGQNLNFGVPSNYVRELTKQLRPLSIGDFAALTRPRPVTVDVGGGKRITRRVPHHDPAIFDGCSEQDVGEAVAAITEAISLGAPLYNQGNHEACYRIYEGASMKFERESGCKGVRDAFGAGLLRASTLDSYTEKAWALRDMFDGLVEVALRVAHQRGPAAPPP